MIQEIFLVVVEGRARSLGLLADPSDHESQGFI
jgi:hypothetical protein